jgi:hypothetical protein
LLPARALTRFSDYMEDDAPKEKPETPAPDFNKLDLSQLQGFSFGTQWTQDKSAPSDRRDRESGGDRPRREDRREGAGPDRRDRRSFRRPSGDAPATAAPGATPAAPERREFNRGPRRDDRGDFRGGPRRDSRGGEFQGYGGRRDQMERGPYESPFYTVTFYPEDTSFNTLVQTIRKSCRTIELFEIARTVVAKPDRFVVVLAHKNSASSDSAAPRTGGPAAPTAPAATPAPEAAARAKAVFYISVPDGMPFESDDAAIAHVLSKHLDKFFDTAEVEVEAPKGNFQVINRCGVTGDLLGPPNYHRYNQIVQQHYTAKIAGRMPLEAFRTRIETVRDPEVVNQWLAQMRKTTRYTWKQGSKPAPVAAAAHAAPAAENAEPTVAPDAAAAADTAAATPAPTAPVAPTTPAFDTLEDARTHLLTNVRDKVVRAVENARFHGKVLEQMPPGEIRRAVEGALDRQRRFPLDTANALRGRLRREHFTIFKKGSKGVSYVCAVKRKFRVPGQTFSDSIGALISFIEANPMVRASELPQKFVGVVIAAVRPAESTAPQAGADTAAKPAADAVRPESTLTVEERAKISRMQGDLMWLVREGYVTEFIDGRLFAPPPMVEARKREVESSEHDPENFPEAPAAAAAQPSTDSKGADEVPIETEIPASEPVPDAPPAAESPSPDSPAV